MCSVSSASGCCESCGDLKLKSFIFHSGLKSVRLFAIPLVGAVESDFFGVFSRVLIFKTRSSEF